MENPETRKEDKKTKLLILLLLLITLAAVCVTVWALFFRSAGPALAPDYAPQKVEQYQKPLEDDTDDKMEAPEGGGAVSLTYSTDVTIDLSDEKAILMFANPGRSTQDIVVQIVIRDEIIVQSGRLTPGNQVTTLDLLEGAAKRLSAGGYDGKFVLLYYDPATGEKAVVNTEIPVDISVIE